MLSFYCYKLGDICYKGVFYDFPQTLVFYFGVGFCLLSEVCLVKMFINSVAPGVKQ